MEYSTPSFRLFPRLPWLLLLVLLTITTLTRLALLIYAYTPDMSVVNIIGSFAIGAFYDIVFACYFFAPWCLLWILIPNFLLRFRFIHAIYLILAAALIFGLLFTAVAEWVFWDEFAARFNFIAVDYLVYTTEVIGNIWQSYPVAKILSVLALLAIVVTFVLRQRLLSPFIVPRSWQQRLVGLVFCIGLPVLLFFTVDSKYKDRFKQDTLNELAGNGGYQFFAAFLANDLNYLQFYKTLPNDVALQTVQHLRQRDDAAWQNAATPQPQLNQQLTQLIRPNPPAKPLNVILVSVESLGAEYVGAAWGDKRNLTPNLDALSKKSLIFSKVYATGNRTVRGLEALSIALPPTPGQSIVKRADNANLFTLGGVLADHHYQPYFIYGGYGYFDNMNGYFQGNGYTAVDRVQVDKSQISFENIWGIADENLYELAIRQIDQALQKHQQPVFAHVMTTSNHRPYTYPANRVDIPSGTGRDGAVKYTDWAIGHFINLLAQKPWFKDTLLIITADHGANARGTSQIPVDKYRIPLLFYSPNHIKPGQIDRVMSQIDIAPTLLGVLNVPYDSRFFGIDVLHDQQTPERAFVANYQALGYLRDGRLVTLLPRRKVLIAPSTEAPPMANPPLSAQQLEQEAIAWYQTAFIAFREKAMKK